MATKYLFNKIVFSVVIILLVLRIPVWGQQKCNYLVWADEFEYEGAPKTEKWGYDIGGNGWGIMNYSITPHQEIIRLLKMEG